MDQPATRTAGRPPRRATTDLVALAEGRQKGQFSACEGGFPLPRKQACRAESRAAVLCDGFLSGAEAV